MPRAVLDMMDRRLVWAMPDWVPHELEEALPEDWELVVINEETDGSGDGITRVAPSILAAVAEAEITGGGARVEVGAFRRCRRRQVSVN